MIKKGRPKAQASGGDSGQKNMTVFLQKNPEKEEPTSTTAEDLKKAPQLQARPGDAPPDPVKMQLEDSAALESRRVAGRVLRTRKINNYNELTHISGVDDSEELTDKALANQLDDSKDPDYVKDQKAVLKEQQKELADSEIELDSNMHQSDEDDDLVDDYEDEVLDENDLALNNAAGGSKRKSKARNKQTAQQKKITDKMAPAKDAANSDEEDICIDNLPQREHELRRMLADVKREIRKLENKFLEEEDSDYPEEQNARMKELWCIPVSVDVRQFNFEKLIKAQLKFAKGRLFDVITIDPPWQLSSSNPTRGVAIAYDTLSDKQIQQIPIQTLQTDGFLFIWVINAKYRLALELMEHWGYEVCDEVVWVKQTVNGKIAKGHGYYLQHAKETCLIGRKGKVDEKARQNIECDVIFSQRRGQSQKPEEIYNMAEALVPDGYYLEIFGRRNNLHNGWVTIGNEI